MNIYRKYVLISVIFIVLIVTSCSADINVAQSIKGIFKWVKTWSGAENVYGRKNAFDSEKNVYIAGYFNGTVDFNPDENITEEYTSMGVYDCFLIKFDKYGEYKWALVWGGLEDDKLYDVCVDSQDNVIVGGYFGDSNSVPGYTIDFNPSDTKTLELISNGGHDCFISSFTKNGVLRWATSWGGSARDEVEAFITDSLNNIYVSGIFEGTVDMNPDPIEMKEFTTVGSNDLFLSRFDSSGNFDLAYAWGGPLFEAAQTMNVDADDNIYVGGIYAGTVDFDPDEINKIEYTSQGSFDCWFSKFDSNMTYQWTKVWGGSDLDWIYGIAVDSLSNIYISGFYTDVVDFDPDEINVINQTSNGSKDAYLSKFDKNGIFIWVQTWGGTMDDRSGTVCLDGKDNIYVSREFGGGGSDPGYTVDFNPSLEIEERSSNGVSDCYLTKFDSEGNFIWVKTWGGSGVDAVYSMTVTREGIIYITGVFSNEVDFNPEDDDDPLTDEDVELRTSKGGYDAYLVTFE